MNDKKTAQTGIHVTQHSHKITKLINAKFFIHTKEAWLEGDVILITKTIISENNKK